MIFSILFRIFNANYQPNILYPMKKKLQLKKEVVSILDRNQMNHLTKGGGQTIPPQCGVGETTPQHCGIIQTLACPTKHLCDSDICIDPQTKKGCGIETGQCISATTCDTDICPIMSAADVCTEKSVNICQLTDKC